MHLILPTRPRPHADAPTDRGRGLLARLFAGDFPLPAVLPAAHPPGPPAEADAAARAAGCRDLFVVDAPDAPARLRVIEAVARAAGGRALVLSPDPVAADRLTERLAAAGVPVLRALGANESADRLPVAVAARTSFALGAVRAEQVKRDAVAAARDADAALAAATAAADQLAAALARLAQIDAEAAALSAHRDRVEADLRADADGLFAARRSEFEARRLALAAERDEAAARRAEKEAAAAALHQQAAEQSAAPKSGFLSRLFSKPKPCGEAVDLDHQAECLEREARELATREKAVQTQLDEAAAAFQADHDRAFAGELSARRAGYDATLAALAAERQPLAAATQNEAAVRGAVRDAEHRLAAARARADEVARDTPDLARRLLAGVAVVVGVPAALDADPVFDAGPPADRPPFGLLVLDRAEELTEPDFVGLTPLAERWVLVGAVTPAGVVRSARRHEPDFLTRLARHLDREPWAVEADRLVCRLAHPTAGQRRRMTREPLLDRPEVELRFAVGDGGEPLLAEIAFPLSTGVPAAKEFVARELGESLLRPCGERHLHETADAVTACWPAAEAVGEVVGWVPLAAGVREKVVGSGSGAFTAAVAFDRSAGWDVASADAWLAERLPAGGASSRLAAVPGRSAF